MKNKDTWEFAHHYCGSLWLKIGTVMLVVSVIGSIFPTEKALKRNFDEYGNRRKQQ